MTPILFQLQCLTSMNEDDVLQCKAILVLPEHGEVVKAARAMFVGNAKQLA